MSSVGVGNDDVASTGAGDHPPVAQLQLTPQSSVQNGSSNNGTTLEVFLVDDAMYQQQAAATVQPIDGVFLDADVPRLPPISIKWQSPASLLASLALMVSNRCTPIAQRTQPRSKSFDENAPHNRHRWKL